MNDRFVHRTRAACAVLALAGLLASPASAQDPLKLFISVDMEGIGGIGSPSMTSSSGKDYATGRELLTAEVNAVVEAIYARNPEAEILVNDSHGDHQNALHTRFDPRVVYIQGSIKPLGMVQGLDGTFDGAIFIGYHAKAGDPDGFLAHTGSGSVKGLWLNDVEVGEGGMNAVLAGFHGVPVILAAGDSAATAELGDLLGSETVTTKTAETPSSARLVHPERVQEMLADGVDRALDRLGAGGFDAYDLGSPVRIRMRFASTTHVDILMSIPGMSKVDGYTVAYTARNADEAYRLIRMMYRFISV
ncbi:MAG: M55 family metallopeptidase [Gemmatimonadota bacterium]|nr:M55 family metallopeptidase [Gemmatimonadota bacterium]MDE3005636.1 M55 family metallopeptidase [Gemmatimonadota bacterium]MDE3013105.1 M55 family metallopeptidase [Gemmatimonadota bacterium]